MPKWHSKRLQLHYGTFGGFKNGHDQFQRLQSWKNSFSGKPENEFYISKLNIKNYRLKSLRIFDFCLCMKISQEQDKQKGNLSINSISRNRPVT